MKAGVAEKKGSGAHGMAEPVAAPAVYHECRRTLLPSSCDEARRD